MPGSSSWRLLQHWINTLPPESCALVSSPEDLTDGQVLCDIVTLLDASAADKFGAAGAGLPRLRALIAHLVRGPAADLCHAVVFDLKGGG